MADLDCGHSRHMRHNPPLANRPWLNSETERIRMLGVELDCQTCDDLAAARVPANHPGRRIAEAVRGEALRAAVEAYQHAKMSGLCQEGAWDLALDAIKHLDLDSILDRLPES